MKVHFWHIVELLLIIPLVVVGVVNIEDGHLLPMLALGAVPLYLAVRLGNWRKERWAARKLAAQTEKITRVEAERDAADTNWEIICAQADTLTKVLAKLESTSAKRIAHLDSLMQLDRTRADLAESSLEQTVQRLNHVRTELLATELRYDEQCSQLRNELSILQVERDRLVSENSQLAEARSQLLAECARLSTESQNRLGLIAEHEKHTNYLNQQIAQLNGQLKTLKTRASDELERLASRKAEIESKLHSETRRTNDLVARLSISEEMARTLQADVYSLRQSVKEYEAAAAITDSLQARLDEEVLARDMQRRELRDLQARYDIVVVGESELRAEILRYTESTTELEDELARCRAERNTLRTNLLTVQERVATLEEIATNAEAELVAARTKAIESQELLAIREQVTERTLSAATSRLAEVVLQLEKAEQLRFELQSKLDTALLTGERAIERADKLSETLAQTQSRLAERERQLAAGERDEPPPHDLEITVAAQAERIGNLERAIAVRDEEIQWLLDQQAALWEPPAASVTA